MVEKKQNDEKQDLLDAIDRERQILANEVESKLKFNLFIKQFSNHVYF